MDLRRLIDEITRTHDYEGQIVHVAAFPGRPATYADLQADLHPAVRAILAGLGIERLYCHQAEAVQAALAGEHLCVVASTAGGKTLCYTLPIAERIYQRPTSRAFLVFPTKALAQDQLRKLGDFGAGTAFTAACYDGDTPTARRRVIRREAQVVLTNPDMLHTAILPNHQLWADFFRRLQFVVLDEVHTYRGVFGSHTANVIRRLRRVAANYGAGPQFICCSATIGNPEELSRKLTGVEVRVVDRDGTPLGPRTWVFWNPPLLKEGFGRRSSLLESAALLCRLVEHGVRTIDFTLARKSAELIVRHCRRILGKGSGLAQAIMAYRGGYLPGERREIEQRLFDGDLLGVVSTSALELGIDIGHLRAVIMTGFPGTIASAFQQAGRAGRGQDEALAVLIAQNSSLDQFLMQHPEFLFGAQSERALIDPENRFIVGGHLLCAAYEVALESSELPLFAPDAEAILGILAEDRHVTRRGGKWYWIGEDHPAGQISLRSTAGGGYDIVDAAHPETRIGTVDARSAFMMVHEGAVYMHLGETYLVRRLDTEQKVAYVEKQEVDYYTDAAMTSEVAIQEETEKSELPSGLTRHLGELFVVERTPSYVVRKPPGTQPLGSHDLDLPAMEYDTVGLWLTFPPEHLEPLQAASQDPTGALHAVEHALAALVPVVAPCDPRDVGGEAYLQHPDLATPAIFLYDGHAGGVGICEAAYDGLPRLLAAARERLAACGCEDGCPSCVQSPYCGSLNRPMDKRGALTLLGRWTGPDGG